MHKATVRIRDDQHEWLQENEYYNLAGAVREMIDEEMKND